MSRPLFSIGEEVSLQSKNYPQHNGDYIVENIISKGEFRKRFSNFMGDGVHYYDVGVVFHGNMDGTPCNFFAESSLRKKHKPSEFGSYEALMNSLKIKEKA